MPIGNIRYEEEKIRKRSISSAILLTKNYN